MCIRDRNCSLYTGPKFTQATFVLEPEDLLFLKQINSIDEKLLTNIPFQPSEVTRILQKISTDLENKGYPFCAVSLREIATDSLTLTAQISIQKGNQYRWKKIHLKGENLISEKLISSYIQIKPNSLYSQQDVQLISARIKQISFIEELKPAELLFTKDGVELFLYLKSKPVSLANGVIGLQPNSNTNRVSLTGDLRLKLVNVLKKAESIDLNWKSLQAQTQTLKVQLNAPN
jgi:outer membrane protein assembly factor BamA